MRGSKWANWGVALTPVALLALYVWSLKTPDLQTGDVLSLAGPWEATLSASEAPPKDVPVAATVSMPGFYADAPDAPNTVWLGRSHKLPPKLQGKPLVFFIGDTRTSNVAVYFDGVRVGAQTVAANGQKVPPYGPSHFFVPPTLTGGETHRIDLRISYIAKIDVGMADQRIYLGTESVLGPYAENQIASEIHIPTGVTFMLFGIGIVLIALWYTQARLGETRARQIYLVPILYLSAGFVWASLYRSIQIPQLFPGPYSVMWAHLMAVGFTPWFALRFVEQFYGVPLRRITRVYFGIISIVAMVITVGCIMHAADFVLTALAVGYACLFPICVHAFVTALVGYWKDRDRPFGLVVLTSIGVMAATATNDMFRELAFVGVPLYSAGMMLMAVCAGAVAIGSFLNLASRMVSLSADLAERNVALKNALARAEESTQVKSAFFANVSHEIRTPLNAIVNLPAGMQKSITDATGAKCGACGTDFELEEGEAFDPATPCPVCNKPELSIIDGLRFTGSIARLKKDLQLIESSSKHLMLVVNDILDISRLESQNFNLQLAPTALSTLLTESVAMVRPIAEQATIKIVVNSSLEPSLELDLDRVRFSQVLVNLLGNAIKFSPQESTVTVTARQVDESIEIAVTDEGIGIAQEDQELIFESFRQVDIRHARATKGSGLGLAISKQLVDLHGGTLSVQSKLGEGSTFTVTLGTGTSGSSS